MKKADKIIGIIAIGIVIFWGTTTYFFNQDISKNKLIAIIKQSGKVIKRIPLGKEENKEIKIIGEGNHYNIITIKDGSVAVVQGDCPHSECVKMGAINKTRQVIACIPNKLTISIEGEKGENDIDINSY